MEAINCRKFNQTQRFRISTLSAIRVLEPLNAESANWNSSIAGSAIVKRNGRRVEERVEQAVMELVVEQPALGQVRVSNELKSTTRMCLDISYVAD